MITVVCFKWRAPTAYRSIFGPECVVALRRMVRRHYPMPHRFVCVTDDPSGLPSDLETIPLWTDYATVPNPHGPLHPSCYRRLRLFAPDAADLIGAERFLVVDLDTVITGDLRPIVDRPEDFVIWGETNPKSFYNGSMFLLRAGTRTKVWTAFDPIRSPRAAYTAGKFGSDQGWISHVLGRGEAMWGREDGVYSYRVHLIPGRNALPKNARVVMFHGQTDPWSPEAQALPWVRQHYNATEAA